MGDVVIGAVATGILFTVGKSLISWYIGSSAVASSFGAAGGLIVLLLWVYYSGPMAACKERAERQTRATHAQVLIAGPR